VLQELFALCNTYSDGCHVFARSAAEGVNMPTRFA